MDAREKLELIAQAVASDISGDNPDTELDTSYDLWIEELRNGRVAVGVIDMGDLYQAVFVWNGSSWEQVGHLGTPQKVIDRIISVRESRRGE